MYEDTEVFHTNSKRRTHMGTADNVMGPFQRANTCVFQIHKFRQSPPPSRAQQVLCVEESIIVWNNSSIVKKVFYSEESLLFRRKYYTLKEVFYSQESLLFSRNIIICRKASIVTFSRTSYVLNKVLYSEESLLFRRTYSQRRASSVPKVNVGGEPPQLDSRPREAVYTCHFPSSEISCFDISGSLSLSAFEGCLCDYEKA